MTISQQELKHILALSKLSANDQELVQFEHDLNDILRMFEHIQNVNTQDIKPMISPLTGHYLARTDVPEMQQHEAVFEDIAPEFTAHHFIVPKVIE